MGRLFDAVASLIGVRQEISFEGQAAMELEALAAQVIDQVDPHAYSFGTKRHSLLAVDNAQLLKQLCADIESGGDQPTMAAQFHHAVANLVVDVCLAARDKVPIGTVGLTGGVFQNAILLRLAKQRLIESGFEVLTHSIVPPNDGGIALGQAVVARNRLRKKEPVV
jgi:hydrogenase maturation protein HypF